MMHFSLNLLRIKGLYMFRAWLAHPQEALHKRHLVYCMRIMSVGCGTVTVKLQPEDEQVMLETYRGFWFSKIWMRSAPHLFHYSDILWFTVSKTLSLRYWFTCDLLSYKCSPFCPRFTVLVWQDYLITRCMFYCTIWSFRSLYLR
jgi:hypothetical protein